MLFVTLVNQKRKMPGDAIVPFKSVYKNWQNENENIGLALGLETKSTNNQPQGKKTHQRTNIRAVKTQRD